MNGLVCSLSGWTERASSENSPLESVEVTDSLAKLLSSHEVRRRNLAAIATHHPELYELASAEPKNPLLRMTRTAQGLPNVVKVNLPAQAPVPYYNPMDPFATLDKDLHPDRLRGGRLVVLLGLGLGFEIEHLARSIVPVVNISRIIVVEKDPDLFRMAVRTTLLEQVLSHPRIHFMVGMDQSQLYAELFRLFTTDFNVAALLRTLKVAYTQGALAFSRDYYMQAVKTVTTAGVQATKWFGNAPQDTLFGMRNVFSNLPVILKNPGINDLAGAFKGRPAIVVAAGPSLAKQIPQIRALRDKALIIAADGALAALLRNGVRPHLVTSLERGPEVASLFTGFEVGDIPMAACPVLHPTAYEAYSGPNLAVYRPYDFFKWLGVEKGTMDTGPSSGNMAFRVAEYLGCDPIILTGQDLAFGPDGRTHSEGTVHEERNLRPPTSEHVTVPGNLGEPVLTTKAWYQFLKYYDYHVTNYAGTCINATEGGALIQGTKVMPLREAAALYLRESFDAAAILRSRLKTPPLEQVNAQARSIFSQSRQTEAALQRIIAACREGYEAARELSENWDPETVAGLPVELETVLSVPQFEHLNDLRRKVLTQDEEHFRLFMITTTQPYLVHWEMEFYAAETEAESAPALTRHLVKRYMEWFDVMEGLAQESLDVLKLGQEALLREFPDVVGEP